MGIKVQQTLVISDKIDEASTSLKTICLSCFKDIQREGGNRMCSLTHTWKILFILFINSLSNIPSG